MERAKIVTIVGTRPEGIKMAPVVRALDRRREVFDHTLVSTAQHRELLDNVLRTLDVVPSIDLELMQPGQSLGQFASRALVALSELFTRLTPDAVLVQGDTTTVMVAGLAAFYQGIKVGHVEAGLRSFDRQNPFPEEINRRITGCVADWHFAPTERTAKNLIAEGVSRDDVFVTGNTIVDALRSIRLDDAFENNKLGEVDFDRRRVLLVTAHRRENHGAPLVAICDALKTISERYEDVEVVYPVHLNPNVRGVVYDRLGDAPRIRLVDPLSYSDLLRVMKRCHLILTDSGGIQEEAPSFGKPVLVLREVTERPEAVESGAAKIVGTDSQRIVCEAARLLDDPDEHERMKAAKNPFGDGHAAERIVQILEDRMAAARGG